MAASPGVASAAVAQSAIPRAEGDAPIARPAWRQLASSTELTRIGFGLCLVQGRPQAIWSAVIAARPQLFLMMGDNVYGDFDTKDGARLAAAYGQVARDADLTRAAASMPMLAIWDDHIFGLNDGGSEFAHKGVAVRMFASFWAGSGTLDGTRGPGIAYGRTFGPEGRRVQVVMLDTRSFRSALRRKPADDKAGGRYVPDADPAKTLLGADQWA